MFSEILFSCHLPCFSFNQQTSYSTFQFEADRRAFIITINSFGTELTKDDREKLYPTCGKLYPDGLKALARADDYDQVRSVAEYYLVISICYALHINAPTCRIRIRPRLVRTYLNFNRYDLD